MAKDWCLLVGCFFFSALAQASSDDWLARSPEASCFESWPLRASPLDLKLRGWHQLRFAREMSFEELRKTCPSLREGDWEPNQKLFASRLRMRPAQNAASPDLWPLVDAKALSLPTTAGLPVAMIDTGIDENHPALRNSLWRNPGESGPDFQGRAKESNGIDDDGNGYVDDVYGWDFIDHDSRPFDEAGREHGHGTHLAGVIAAQASEAGAVRGISPGTPLMILRFIDAQGHGNTAAAIQALRYALNQGVRVINVSWGGDEAAIANSAALRDAFLETRARGALVIVAAGNGSVDVDAHPERAVPASYRLENMIVVAASGPGGHRAVFSNYGVQTVDLAAPGVGVLSTIPGGGWGRIDGSSVAVPYVSGALSLVWALFPHLRADQMKAALLASVTPTPTLSQRVRTSGRLNAEALKNEAAKIR